MKKLPQRVFNSPMIKYTNFADGTHVNIIRLAKPYKNGSNYAVYHGTLQPTNLSGLFKSLGNAIVRYNKVIQQTTNYTTILKAG